MAAILLLCFHFVRKTIAPAGVNDGAGLVILVAVGLLVVGNDVTKAFFWSPHTQLFNVFVPVLALDATLRVLDGAAFDRRFAVGVGLAVGLGVTAYGVFIVVVACLMLPWLWAFTREAIARAAPARARQSGIAARAEHRPDGALVLLRGWDDGRILPYRGGAFRSGRLDSGSSRAGRVSCVGFS